MIENISYYEDWELKDLLSEAKRLVNAIEQETNDRIQAREAFLRKIGAKKCPHFTKTT